MVTMKNLKDMLQIFQKEKNLMDLDGSTLIFLHIFSLNYFFFFCFSSKMFSTYVFVYF